MRTLFLFSIALTQIMMICLPGDALAEVRIFACEPEWAALAEEIGGEKAKTFSATTAAQDPHHIRAKPSLIAAMRKSDLVIGSGAGLEIGWLPILLRKAGNAAVQPGGLGFLMAADVIPLLEKPERLDRSLGDIHREGNPHVHLDPRNIAMMAKTLTERLGQIDPANVDYFLNRHSDFVDMWNEAVRRWEREGASLKGAPVVVHHTSFAYLEDWLDLRRVSTLEPRPGIPPTISHLETLLQSLRKQPVQVILHSPYDPEDASFWLSEKTGIPAVKLPYTVGGDKESSDLFRLFDRTISLLQGAIVDQQ